MEVGSSLVCSTRIAIMLNIVRIITLYSNDFSIVRIVFLFKELHSRSEASAFSKSSQQLPYNRPGSHLANTFIAGRPTVADNGPVHTSDLIF